MVNCTTNKEVYKMRKTRIFYVNDCTFVYCEHDVIRSLAEYEPKFDLMIHDADLGCYRTISHPRNITEAKEFAKEYLLYA